VSVDVRRESGHKRVAVSRRHESEPARKASLWVSLEFEPVLQVPAVAASAEPSLSLNLNPNMDMNLGVNPPSRASGSWPWSFLGAVGPSTHVDLAHVGLHLGLHRNLQRKRRPGIGVGLGL
jgi:hypothetical protein